MAYHAPETRPSLLVRLRDARDARAWTTFVEVYAPLIHAYCIHRGAQDADAADIAQQVLQSVARAMPGFEYDASKGTFRGWLLTITRNCLQQHLRTRHRGTSGSGDSQMQQVLAAQPDPHNDEELWELEHQRQLFRWAAEQVQTEFKSTTWEAFRLVAVEHLSAPEVAERCQISVGAVYIAKSRVTARMRELLAELE